MPTCGDCRLLARDPKETARFRCQAKKCGATKVTPEKDASRCKKFERK